MFLKIIFWFFLTSSFIYGTDWNRIVELSKKNQRIYSTIRSKGYGFPRLKSRIDMPLDANRYTLLYYAIDESEFELAKLLLESGANLDLVYDAVDQLIDRSCRAGDDRLLKFLKERIKIYLNKKEKNTVDPWVKLLFHRNYKELKYLKNYKTKNLLIPKIIHQIWIGPNPVPEKVKWMMDSWKIKNPGWSYKLWLNTDLEDFHLENQKAFDQAINWGMKSDLWRCEILDRFGGVYVDIDFECLKPINELHFLYDFYCCIIPGNNGAVVANGIIGAKPGHPIIKSCLKQWKNSQNFATENTNLIMDLTGPFFLTNRVVEYLYDSPPNSRLIIFPEKYFFPFPNTFRRDYWSGSLSRDKILEKYECNDSFGIHYWATSWVKH